MHRGPRYNISLEEVSKKYNQMRKGNCFYASKKVLWRNRHALVLGCSNFYRKGKDDENVKVDNKEYDIVEPPEPYDDPVVPTTGGEFSSDDSKDGPVKRNFNRERKECDSDKKSEEGSIVVDRVETSHTLQMSRSSNGRGGHTQQDQITQPKMDFSKILQNTAHRRKKVQVVSRISPQVHHKDERMQKRYSGARGSDLLQSSGLTTDTVIWAYICKVGKNLADRVLLKIFSDFDGRVRTKELNRSQNNLEELIAEGTNDPMVLKLWKTTLEAKKKQLVEHQGIVPGTPETSDDEDEEDAEYDSTFCAVQSQRSSCIVSPNGRNNQNFYQNDPVPQQIIPHELIINVRPQEKSRSSEGRGVRTQQEQINYPLLRKKDKQVAATQQVSCRRVKLNARTNLEHTRRIEQNYMENEAFLSRYSYGGGKRKSKDSDGEYDPNHAKKLKRKKINRKNNRKRKKGDQRTLDRKNAVRVAISKTNAKNNPKRTKAVIQKSNLETNAERPKGDNRSSEHIAAVQERNSKTNPIYNPINNPINNPKRPLKELNEYNEDSIYPPTLKQVHDAGNFPANAKAAACA